MDGLEFLGQTTGVKIPMGALTPIFVVCWMALGAMLLWLVAKVVIGRWLRRLGRLPRMERIHAMTGREFELALRQIFERDGWWVEMTPRSGDFGADLVLRKEGKRIVVQAKRWKKPVGVRAIQEALGARDVYRADEAWVVTQSLFTHAAAEQARASRVVLRDGAWLASELSRLGSASRDVA